MRGQKFLLFLFFLPALAAIALGADGVYLVTHPVVVIEWSTASELDMVGFNLYRSEDQKGDFRILNDKLIPSSSDALVGANYSFRDTSVKAGQPYDYLIEDVDVNGATNRNGPIHVTAEAGGIPELVVTVLLAFVASGSLFLLLREYKVNNRDVHSIQ